MTETAARAPSPDALGLDQAQSLWHNPDFLKLWAGQTLSGLGNYTTHFALPTLAILAYNAGSLEVGALRSVRMLPFPVLGLVVGVLVDRVRRRRLLVATDLVRLLLVAAVPALFWSGRLALATLYVVSLLIGVATVFFQCAYRAYLPSLIPRAALPEGNQKLTLTDTTAQFVGFSVAGALVQAVGAALTMLVDAVSFLVSAISLWWIRAEELPVESSRKGLRTIPGDIWEGMLVARREPIVWATMMALVALNFGVAIRDAVLLLYAYRTLHLSPAGMGLVFSLAGVAAVAGSYVSIRLTRRIGLGPSIATAAAIASISLASIPLAGHGHPLLVLAALQCVFAMQIPIVNINQASYAQAVLPRHMLGRLVGTSMTFTMGAIPAGALVGGLLGASLGYQSALVAGGLASGLGALWLFVGPVFRLRTAPVPRQPGSGVRS